MAKLTTRYCSLDELRPELSEVISGHLSEDDEPIICCETKYRSFLDGTTEYYGHVVTQHRIVFSMSKIKGVFDRLVSRRKYDTTVSSILLVDIVSILEQEADPGFTVYVYRPGNSFSGCDFASRQSSLRFTKILHDAMEKAKQNKGIIRANKSQSESSSEYVVPELEKLAALYQSNALTKEEFESAKKKLLGL
jgi:hypothetical protein